MQSSQWGPGSTILCNLTSKVHDSWGVQDSSWWVTIISSTKTIPRFVDPQQWKVLANWTFSVLLSRKWCARQGWFCYLGIHTYIQLDTFIRGNDKSEKKKKKVQFQSFQQSLFLSLKVRNCSQNNILNKNIPLIPSLLHCKDFECMSPTKISQKKVNSNLNSYFTYNLKHIKNLIQKELQFWEIEKEWPKGWKFQKLEIHMGNIQCC